MITFLRVVVSFAIVGLVLYAFVKASSGRLGSILGGPRSGREVALEVIERRQLTRNSTIALLRAGDRHLLVGVGDGSVTLLLEGDHLAPSGDDDEKRDDENQNDHRSKPRKGGFLRPPGRDSIDHDLLDDDSGEDDGQTTDNELAWTRLSEANEPLSAGMTLLATLRELTVRRS